MERASLDKNQLLPSVMTIYGSDVHLRLVGSALTLGDALDTDARRAPELYSKYVLTLPPEHQRHWKVCQSITGIRFELDNSNIVLDALCRTDEERQLLIWKTRDLFDELERESHVMARYGINYSNVMAHTESEEPKSSFIISGQEEMTRLLNNLPLFPKNVDSFSKELRQIRCQSKKEEDKIRESIEIFKSYLSQYNFTRFEHSFEFQNLRKIDRIRQEKMIYYEKGYTVTEIYRKIINISDLPYREETLAFQCVEPARKGVFKLEIFDDSGHFLPYEYLLDFPHEKKIKVKLKQVKPSGYFGYKVRVKWPYPRQKSTRRRWYAMNINSFTVDFELNIMLPQNLPPTDVQIGETVHQAEYEWEKLIGEIKPVFDKRRKKYIISWRKKILNDAKQILKCYFTTPR